MASLDAPPFEADGTTSPALDWVPEAIAFLETDTLLILAANATFRQAIAPLSIVKGLPFLDTVIRASDRNRMKVALDAARNQDTVPSVYGVQTIKLDAEGRFPRWLSFDWMIRPHGRVLLATARQVTVVRDHEKEAEDEYADFFNKAPIALHWLSGSGHVLWANETEMNILGYTAEEYIGQPIMKFCPDEEELVLDIFKQLGSGNTIRDVPVRFRTKAGQIKHLLIDSNVNWNEDGTFKHTRCFIRDDTARKVNEARQLAEAKAHAEMVRQKDTFMQKIFHEIRTPCHALQMTTRTLMEAMGDTPHKQELETAWAQSVHISKLADDVKCAMMLQEGQAPIVNEQWFQVSAMAQEMKTLVNNLFPKSTVSFDVVLDGVAKEDLLMLGDMDLLATVLRHLLTNAMKFTEEGYVRLTVRVGNEDPSRAKQPVTFIIANTGPPLDVDVVYRIWQKYWQGAEDPSEPGSKTSHLCERTGGFGLGLHIAFNFVQLLGGQLEVESNLDCTTFHFTLDTEVQSMSLSDGSEDESSFAQLSTDNTQTFTEKHPKGLTEGLTATTDPPEKKKKDKKEKKEKKEKAATTSKWLCLVPWAGQNKTKPKEFKEVAAEATTQWTNVVEMPVAKRHFQPDADREVAARKGINPLAAAALTVKRVNVLVVDDNTICQRVVGNCLKNLGVDHGVANNGKIACSIVEADPKLYDLILMDLRMPVMDGIAATHEIRTKLMLTMPIVAFSAEVGKEAREEAFAAGADDFLEKPATPKILLEMLQRFNLL